MDGGRTVDAQGALAYLKSRPDVLSDRIYLQGWSNGASTALNTMYRQPGAPAADGFRAALVFYPGCGAKALISQKYRASGPTFVFLGADGGEVNPEVCRRVLTDAPAGQGSVQVVTYEGATHDFDDPGRARQSVTGNRLAAQDAISRAEAIVLRVAP